MAFMSPSLRLIRLIYPRASFSSSFSTVKLAGGVSMVQGASRGIGLEFVTVSESQRYVVALSILTQCSSTKNAPKQLDFLLSGYVSISLANPICSSIFMWYSKRVTPRLLVQNIVKQLLEKNERGQVVATCRNPNEATGLLSLKNKFDERLSIQQLDVTVESTIEECAKSIQERYGSLNLLINASGVLSISDKLQPETTLSKVQKSSLLFAYEVNAVGPILVIKHMWPLLKNGGGSGTERDVAIVANLSARVGSIGDNRLGGWHSYRSSKSALNQLTKTISVEFARKKDPIICILLHPGTVDTDLSRPFQRNVPEGKLFTKEFSVQNLLSIINGAKRQDNGKFFAWDGQEIPW